MLKEIRVKQEKRASVIPLPRWRVMTLIKVKTKHLMFKAGGEKPLCSPVIGRMSEGQGGGDGEDDERHKL